MRCGADVRFSNRPLRVKHFQTIHHDRIDVAHGLVLLFGIGTKALPSWDSKTRWNNLWVGIVVIVTAGPSGHANSPHPSSREGHHATGRWSSSCHSAARTGRGLGTRIAAGGQFVVPLGHGPYPQQVGRPQQYLGVPSALGNQAETALLLDRRRRRGQFAIVAVFAARECDFSQGHRSGIEICLNSIPLLEALLVCAYWGASQSAIIGPRL